MYKLPKKRILRKNKEFQKVYRYGHSYADRYLVLYVFSYVHGNHAFISSKAYLVEMFVSFDQHLLNER